MFTGTAKDYHGNFDGRTFENFLREEVIPVLDELGPCLVLLDQGRYQQERAREFYPSLADRRK